VRLNGPLAGSVAESSYLPVPVKIDTAFLFPHAA
jgi:hypothetical protein